MLVAVCGTQVGSNPQLAGVTRCSLCAGQASSITALSSTHFFTFLLVLSPRPRRGMLAALPMDQGFSFMSRTYQCP